jgi:hypothetical protein
VSNDHSGRVLVVEDDEAIADVLRRSLRAEGHDVRSAGDGAEALTAAEQFAPDLVVLDLGLPRLDGMEVIGSRASTWVRTTTCRSPSNARSCSLGSGRSSAAARPEEAPRWSLATSSSIRIRER